MGNPMKFHIGTENSFSSYGYIAMPNRVEKTANSIPIRKVDNFTYWILLNVESFVLFSGLPITKGTNGEQIFYHPHYPALRAEICKDCRNVIPIRPKAFSKPLTKKQLGEFQECFQMFDKVSLPLNFFKKNRHCSLLSFRGFAIHLWSVCCYRLS